jgi:Integrase core domain
MVEYCEICKFCKSSRKGRASLFTPIDTPKSVGEFISADLAGPIAGLVQGEHLLVVVDRLSKFVWVRPSKTYPTASETVDFFEKIRKENGTGVKRLLTDNGKIFVSKEVTTWAQQSEISLSRTSAYYPQGDRITERMIQSLSQKIIIQPYTQIEEITDGIPLITAAVGALNNTPTTSTKMPPRKVFEARFQNTWDDKETIEQAVSNMTIYNKNIERRENNGKVGKEKIAFREGTHVLISKKVWSSTKLNKLETRYAGPFCISCMLNPRVAVVDLRGFKTKNRTERYNIDSLRLFKSAYNP